MRPQSLFVSALLLGACAVGPDHKGVDLSTLTPAAFEDTGAATAPADWWRTLNDPVLDGLVADALAANRDLRAAEANARAARADFGFSRFDYAPTVRTDAQYRRQRVSADGLGATIPGIPAGEPFPDTDLFDAGLIAGWELDFWGRVRRSVQTAKANYEGAEADRRSAAVLVTADVAASYAALRGAERQRDVAMKNAQRQAETRSLTESLERAGRASSLDAARARAQAEATQATVPPLEAAIAREKRRLAVLTGRSPDGLEAALSEPAAFPKIPDAAPGGDPALILRQRPDIMRAERDLAAATAQIGVATADLFPRVRFVGAFGASSTTLSSFGAAPSVDYGFGPTIEWAAFDLGRVRARIRQSEARADAALARYEQTALRALEETANAFTDLARERERNARLKASVEASADAAALADARYRAGLDDFLAVLDADRRLLEAESALADSDTRLLRNFVGVYRALGGGWRVIDVDRIATAAAR